MKSYLVYKDKSVLAFKRYINSYGGLFDKSRPLVVSFIKYAGGDLDKNIATYSSVLDINSILLENVFPVKYKWLVKDKAFKDSRDFLKAVENRVTEFQGKEDNLKVLVGFLFLRFLLITKLVEAYMAVAYVYSKQGVDISGLTLDKLGIGKSTLKYFDELENIGTKNIDDWLAFKLDPVESKYFYSSMRRMLMILVGDGQVSN